MAGRRSLIQGPEVAPTARYLSGQVADWGFRVATGRPAGYTAARVALGHFWGVAQSAASCRRIRVRSAARSVNSGSTVQCRPRPDMS
jgi:hypothetical protein